MAGAAQAAPLADRHIGRGLTCDKCHTPAPPTVKFENCLQCHGGVDKLISRKPVHAVLKNGKPNCGMCHKGHKAHTKIPLSETGQGIFFDVRNPGKPRSDN